MFFAAQELNKSLYVKLFNRWRNHLQLFGRAVEPSSAGRLHNPLETFGDFIQVS